MKSLSDYLTPTALTRWNTIKSNPQHAGFTTKQLLSNIISRTPATFLLDLSAAQAEVLAGETPVIEDRLADVRAAQKTKSSPTIDELMATYGDD